MQLPFLAMPTFLRGWLDRPSRQVFVRLTVFNLAIVVAVLTLGGPLGDLKRMPFSVWWAPHILFSPELICTAISFFQLMLCAWVLREAWQLRGQQVEQQGLPRSAARLWLWMYVGFLFLALDEIACIHEGLDKLIHWAFQIRETSLSDRIDDFILLAYGIVGLAVLAAHWKEVKIFWRQWVYMLGAFVLALSSVGLDLLTNRKDVLWLWFESEAASVWWAKLNALEECCKILAEGVLAGMFFACREALHLLHGSPILAFPQAAAVEPSRRRAA